MALLQTGPWSNLRPAAGQKRFKQPGKRTQVPPMRSRPPVTHNETARGGDPSAPRGRSAHSTAGWSLGSIPPLGRVLPLFSSAATFAMSVGCCLPLRCAVVRCVLLGCRCAQRLGIGIGHPAPGPCHPCGGGPHSPPVRFPVLPLADGHTYVGCRLGAAGLTRSVALCATPAQKFVWRRTHLAFAVSPWMAEGFMLVWRAGALAASMLSS